MKGDADDHALLFQKAQPMFQAFGSFVAEVAHALLVVLVTEDVESLLLEIQPLGVRLLCVDDELFQTVREGLENLLLPQFLEVYFKDPVQQRMRFMGETGEPECERNRPQGGLLYLGNVDPRGHPACKYIKKRAGAPSCGCVAVRPVTRPLCGLPSGCRSCFGDPS